MPVRKSFPIYFVLIMIILHSAIDGVSQSAQSIGDGLPATQATIESPSGVAVDRQGNLYIAERRGNRIRKVDNKTGIVSTLAGTGVKGFSGDDGPASKAMIANPEVMVVDNENNLIITDRSNYRVRRINLKTGIITTIAGKGEFGYSGDGGEATKARISNPFGLMVDKGNNLFILDTENHAVRKVDAKTGIITTIAGNGEKGIVPAGQSSLSACFRRPHVGAIAPDGNIYIGDSFNHRICVIDPETSMIVKTYGNGEEGSTEDGVSAEDAKFFYFGSLVFYNNKLIFSEWANDKIREIDLKTGQLTSRTGTDDKPLIVKGPYGIALDSNNALYISEVQKNRVLKYNLKTGSVSVVAGK